MCVLAGRGESGVKLLCIYCVVNAESTRGGDQRRPNAGSLFAVRYRQPGRRRVMHRDFLESVDPGNRKHTGLLIDFELVAFVCVYFLAVGKPDYEHRVPPWRAVSVRKSLAAGAANCASPT